MFVFVRRLEIVGRESRSLSENRMLITRTSFFKKRKGSKRLYLPSSEWLFYYFVVTILKKFAIHAAARAHAKLNFKIRQIIEFANQKKLFHLLLYKQILALLLPKKPKMWQILLLIDSNSVWCLLLPIFDWYIYYVIIMILSTHLSTNTLIFWWIG